MSGLDYDPRINDLLAKHVVLKERLSKDEIKQLRALLTDMYPVAAPRVPYDELIHLGLILAGTKRLADKLLADA